MSRPRQKKNMQSNYFESDGETSPRQNYGNLDEKLTGIFEIDHKSYDVTLSDTKLNWSPMGTVIKKKKSKKKHKSHDDDNENQVLLKDIYGVRVKYQKPGDGMVLGVEVYTYERKDFNRLKDRPILLGHPSGEVCSLWATRIDQIISGLPGRLRKVKVFVQAHAGIKTRYIYRALVHPILLGAKIEQDITEVIHNETIKQEMVHLKLSNYDCIICVGGDGTVNKLVNGLLNKTQQNHGIDVKPTTNPAKPMIPIGIVPTGSSNNIAHSVLGTDDPVSAVLHIVLGHKCPVDVCSTYHNEKFHSWGFNFQYGFGGNILVFANRYSKLGQRKVEAAFLKGLTKSKLRPYDCDIQYIPSPKNTESNPLDGVVCHTGCSVCLDSSMGGSNFGSVYSDSLQEYDPLAISGTSSTIIDLTKESPWRSTKGSYMNVAVFTLPGLSEMAPQGLSKYTHLADGCMDLVLVRNTERKDFIRYLKRHGNSKNQFDFPFVEVHRVKDLRIRGRLGTTWKHKDWDFNEVQYEMKKLELSVISERSMEVVNDLSDIDDDDEDIKSLGSGAGLSDDDEDNSNDPKAQNNMRQSYSAPVYRKTFYEQNRERRSKKTRDKEEKKKQSEEMKTRSVWNMDSEIQRDIDLDFRIHPQLLLICGQGLHPQTPRQEAKMGCLPAF
ncbi:unnamed protein product [Owenia fusiformis]|uniref:Uncharacterized protein n=1 Tax=Owenia fusiformis TaxID=6347 RepID=A0A8J1TVH0_OWEFU|nr:unnamed protein product [Owenia fusiformis]